MFSVFIKLCKTCFILVIVMYQKLRDKYITDNRIRIAAALLIPVLLLIFWKWLPKSFSTINSPVVVLLGIDLLLGLLVAVDFPVSEKMERVLAYAFLVIIPALSYVLMEILTGNLGKQRSLLMVVLNYALYFMVYFWVYILTNRIRISITVGVCFFTFFAMVNSFVLEFRRTPIRSADIFAASTAAGVVEEYRFIFSAKQAAVLLIALGILFTVYHIRYVMTHKKIRMARTVLGILMVVAAYALFWNDSFIRAHKMKPYTWDVLDSARDHGELLDFVSGIPYFKVDKPEGYTKKLAQEIETEGAALASGTLDVRTAFDSDAAREKPDIIVIMNESFSDLKRAGDFETDVPYMEFFDSMEDNVLKGYTAVPVFGGETVSTEFEFLTGFSNAFFPSGVTGFQNYVRNGTFNLGQELQERGYYSVFLHPYKAKGYNRTNVYRSFGFDEMHFYDDYFWQLNVRDLISDESNYKELIDRYEALKKDNKSVFIFNVTMQNHGGYDKGGYEATVHVTNPKGDYPKTEQFLSLIRESDEAFRGLIEYFENSSHPVVICMFGDHQPSVEEAFYKKIQKNLSGTKLEKTARKFQTPFVIYTNYEMEEETFDVMSVNYLNLLVLKAAGLPLNDYQDYLEGLYESWPVVNAKGSMDRDGKWTAWEEAKDREEIRQYEMVQYLELFDR